MLADTLTPIAIVLEFVIFIIGCYAGAFMKKQAGYLFALAFLLFGLYDIFAMMRLGPDLNSVINIIAILAALGGIIIYVRKN